MRTIPAPVRLACLLLIYGLQAATNASAQGTAFTYQGRLQDGGNPAIGSYDLRFALFDAPSAGAQQGSLITNSATAVSNGLFTVSLDFGNQFPGANRWLEIAVRTNGNGAFATLVPRQPLTPTPYAITAGTVLSGGLASGTYGNAVTLNNAANQISGSFSGNGASVTNVNAASLGGLAASNYWRLTGNAVATNQFLGSTNNVNLELRANNETAMCFSYRSNATYGVSPAVIGGYKGNSASFNLFGNIDYRGATIGGGGCSSAPNYVWADLGTVVGGAGNIASEVGSFVGGGSNNFASGSFASVLGGSGNKATNYYAVAMGALTVASGFASTAMGYFTTASGSYSTAMGVFTTADGNSSTAMGTSTTASGGSSTAMGNGTTASGQYSTAMGKDANAIHHGSFVWSDSSSTSGMSSVGTHTFNVRATGGAHFQGGSDASLAGGGFLILGATNSANLVLDSNEIMARSSGATATLTLNASGGNVVVGGTIIGSSDRNLKENFAAVDARAVLDKVLQLPITEWNYKATAPQRHVGPMAQDFHAAFGLGPDDKHIATVDADGVALAAIQGLNEKLEARSQKLETENAELKARLEKLEQLINQKHK
ncbi:MAG: tail fiber domain-containing protein [Verrucomicrobiota bacterium]